VDVKKIEQEAREELRLEHRRERIEQIKQWYRKPLWVRLFPWKIKIVITRRDYDRA